MDRTRRDPGEPSPRERPLHLVFRASVTVRVRSDRRSCSLSSRLRRLPFLGSKKRKSKVRGRGVPGVEVRSKRRDFFTQGIGKLFEGGITESRLAYAENALGLHPVNGYRLRPIVKRALKIPSDQLCLPPTYDCPHVMGGKP